LPTMARAIRHHQDTWIPILMDRAAQAILEEQKLLTDIHLGWRHLMSGRLLTGAAMWFPTEHPSPSSGRKTGPKWRRGHIVRRLLIRLQLHKVAHGIG